MIEHTRVTCTSFFYFPGESQHVAIDFGNMETTTGQVLLTIVGDDQTTDTVIINRYT